MGPTGVFTPHFGRVYGMSVAAKGVVVAACCITLVGACARRPSLGGEEGWAEGSGGVSRGVSQGWADTGRSHRRWALLGSVPRRSEGCSLSAVGGVGWP